MSLIFKAFQGIRNYVAGFRQVGWPPRPTLLPPIPLFTRPELTNLTLLSGVLSAVVVLVG